MEGFGEEVGISGKDSGTLDASATCNTACFHGVPKVRHILVQSDHAAMAEVDHHLRSVSPLGKRHTRTVERPEQPHWRWMQSWGGSFFAP